MRYTENLTITHPNLAKEWHPTKNGNLLPTMVSKGQELKVWWLCEKGHEWVAYISIRSKDGTGCPICAGKQVLQGYNDLATTNPKLVLEWHPTKNGNLQSTMVTKGSHKKVWWQCKNGHEWQAEIENRTNGSGCPYCNNKKILQGFNDFATTKPELAKEWHPIKNGNLQPTMVFKGCNKKIWWLDNFGHEWRDTVLHRTNGRGCPYCKPRTIPTKSKAHKYVLDMLETCHIDYIQEFRHPKLKAYPYDIYIYLQKNVLLR